MFICFNYTKTLELYGYSILEDSVSKIDSKIVYIHGSLTNDNSVIFGYGDELDSYSMNVRENKDNAFLEFNKAVLYARSGEYQKIIPYIYSETDYEVYILGHSCANSDRALLNEILDNKQCKVIKYFYFDGGQGKEANFKEQISNLYRIFGEDHRRFRSVFCPLYKSERIPQILDIENYLVDEGSNASTKIIEILGIQFVEIKGDVLENGTKIDDFWIGRYPITELQWKNIMGDDSLLIERNGDDFPVVGIKYDACYDFTKVLTSQTGIKVFLPTLEQWQFAARGGKASRKYKYAGGEDLDEVGWYKDNSNNQLHPVGKKKPNELGIFDMSGNVWEFTKKSNNDEIVSYKANENDVINAKDVLDDEISSISVFPLGLKSIHRLVLEKKYDHVNWMSLMNHIQNNMIKIVGGGYNSESTECAVASKNYYSNQEDVGFRVVIKF